MTRIVAGSAGGRTLRVPMRGTRPTSDRVREAIFSRLEHLAVIEDARVLDLYSGSGALGLEAASRGARAVVLVDSSRDAVQIAQRNIADLDLPAVDTVRCDVGRYLRTPPPAPWDLVFADPPYDLANSVLSGVLDQISGALAPAATVVVERSVRTGEPDWPAGWSMTSRDYGETRVFIGGLADGPDSEAMPGRLP